MSVPSFPVNWLIEEENWGPPSPLGTQEFQAYWLHKTDEAENNTKMKMTIKKKTKLTVGGSGMIGVQKKYRYRTGCSIPWNLSLLEEYRTFHQSSAIPIVGPGDCTELCNRSSTFRVQQFLHYKKGERLSLLDCLRTPTFMLSMKNAWSLLCLKISS